MANGSWGNLADLYTTPGVIVDGVKNPGEYQLPANSGPPPAPTPPPPPAPYAPGPPVEPTTPGSWSNLNPYNPAWQNIPGTIINGGPPPTLIYPETASPPPTTPATPSGGTPSNPSPVIPPPINQTRTVKVAEPDIIALNTDLIQSDALSLLLFNQIGGIELISTNRSDTINGEIVIYNPITDLRKVSLQFNPTNILSNLKTEDYYFAKFAINIFTRIVDEPKDVVKIETINNPSIFPITGTGNAMSFNLDYLNAGEELEIQFIVSGNIQNVGNSTL